MKQFKYTLNSEGYPAAFGYMDFEHSLIGDEPFTGFDIENYRKNPETGEWERIEKIDWHEPDKSIQIILTHQQNTELVIAVPEIAVYRKENDIHVYQDDDFVYSYVDWLLGEHREILEQFGAMINEV